MPVKRAKKQATKKPTLNIRQERFAELVASGMPATQAYMRAGYSDSIIIAEANAYRVMEYDGVKARIAVLRAVQTEESMRKKEDNLRWLAGAITTPIGEIGTDSPFCTEYTEEIIGGGARGKLKRGKEERGNEVIESTVLRRKVKKADPLRAIDLFSRLAGHFAPDKLEIDATPDVLKSIRERAQYVAGVLSLARPEHMGTHKPEQE